MVLCSLALESFRIFLNGDISNYMLQFLDNLIIITIIKM